MLPLSSFNNRIFKGEILYLGIALQIYKIFN